MMASPRADEILAPGEFVARFDDLFTRSAFRLELLAHYEGEGFRRWLAGEPVTTREWEQLVRRWRMSGRAVSRVHVLPEVLTAYLRFELECYAGSVAAGEDVRLLPPERADGLGLPSRDFWLFDRAVVAVMFYDDPGNWLRAELVSNPEFVSECCRWRDVAMNLAIPVSEYKAGVPA
jgi:hypothetical protein